MRIFFNVFFVCPSVSRRIMLAHDTRGGFDGIPGDSEPFR